VGGQKEFIASDLASRIDKISLRPGMRSSFLKRFKYHIGDLLATLVLSLGVTLFRGLPQRSFVVASRAVGNIASCLLKKYRDSMLRNLSLAFGKEKDAEEIHRIMKEAFYHLAMTAFETIYGIANSPRYLQEITIEGKEHLDAALRHGNGVIAIGAHLGLFTTAGSKLGTEGYKVNTVIDMAKFPRLWKRINQIQIRFCESAISSKPASSSLIKSLNCLRRNEILYIIADQQQRRGGIAVPFFGRRAFTPPGPAIFSVKTGAPLLPVFVVREDDIRRKLLIGKPIDMDGTSDEKKDIETLTARMTEAIEEMVRQYPSQWAWLNRRWKQPRPNNSIPPL
jgi:Kdo2-lipid IVA lauroyltransferase/acyltransferase